jgi:hypothetical protein
MLIFGRSAQSRQFTCFSEGLRLELATHDRELELGLNRDNSSAAAEGRNNFFLISSILINLKNCNSLIDGVW